MFPVLFVLAGEGCQKNWRLRWKFCLSHGFSRCLEAQDLGFIPSSLFVLCQKRLIFFFFSCYKPGVLCASGLAGNPSKTVVGHVKNSYAC